jgi:DUF1365 family protein
MGSIVNDLQYVEAQVMHKRLFPKVNAFNYGLYYLSLPLHRLDELAIAYNKFGLTSFYNIDHGPRDGSDLLIWAKNILQEFGLKDFDGTITLIAMPRILGYVFNPISYWLCYNRNGNLVAYICEVNNTFDETHVYVCAHENFSFVTSNDVLYGDKVCHVSPFMDREGYYSFKLNVSDKKFNSMIDYYDTDRKLITSLNGHFLPLNKESTMKLFWRYPMVTFKAIAMIHWQAIKIVWKKISYVPKPEQKVERITKTKRKG